MAASDNLGPQFRVMTTRQLGRMTAGDFGRPVSEITRFDVGRTKDGKAQTIDDLAQDISENGLRNHVDVYMGRTKPVLSNGHHRYLAAEQAGVRKMPARVTYPEDVRDVVNFLGRYTPPSG